MTNERYAALSDSSTLPLTDEEIKLGWHFCDEFDGLLVGPEMMETEFCHCFQDKPIGFYPDGHWNEEKTKMENETDNQIIADKELRRDLDTQLQKLKGLPKSRERALSTTKLQEAIMWLGMDLKELNDTRPYPSSYDPTNTKVEPTADGLKL